MRLWSMGGAETHIACPTGLERQVSYGQLGLGNSGAAEATAAG